MSLSIGTIIQRTAEWEGGVLLGVSLCLQWSQTVHRSDDGVLKASSNDRFPIWNDQLILRWPLADSFKE